MCWHELKFTCERSSKTRCDNVCVCVSVCMAICMCELQQRFVIFPSYDCLLLIVYIVHQQTTKKNLFFMRVNESVFCRSQRGSKVNYQFFELLTQRQTFHTKYHQKLKNHFETKLVSYPKNASFIHFFKTLFLTYSHNHLKRPLYRVVDMNEYTGNLCVCAYILHMRDCREYQDRFFEKWVLQIKCGPQLHLLGC